MSSAPNSVIVAVSGPDQPTGDAYTGPRRTLDQIVAKVSEYVTTAQTGSDAAEKWSEGLLHIPLMVLLRVQSQTGQPAKASAVPLTQRLSALVLDALDYVSTASRCAAVANLTAPLADGALADLADDGAATLNIVLTEVRADVNGIDTLLTQLVVTVGPAPTATSSHQLSLDVKSTAHRFDYATLLSDPQIARKWADLMKGVDPDTVTRRPDFRQITVLASS